MTPSEAPDAPAVGFLTPIDFPELVFGLVGPLGSNLSLVTEILGQELSKVEYDSQVIRLSSLLHEIKKYKRLRNYSAEEARIDKHMDKGNDFRKTLKRGDALALLSIAAIRTKRKARLGESSGAPQRLAYVIRSLKHPGEIETLRKVYRRGFIQISCYSPKSQRLASITSGIARSRHDANEDSYRSAAERLINRDQAEINDEYGQNVRDTFPTADVIIDANNKGTIRQFLSHFFEILFRHPSHTPNIDEYGMFLARSAALRSSSSSRQVGAAILSSSGELIAIGCNEVPKAGGGQYWIGDKYDQRDHVFGPDTSVLVKRKMLGEILYRFKKARWLADHISKKKIDDLVDEALTGGDNPLMRGAQLMDILEFGRVVHAEMAALCDAARLGLPTKAATLYCTTFPCHICARHIVASGIERVVYVEPYPKSKAAELYPDSISVEGEKGREDSVSFVPFVGVAPFYFAEFFDGAHREDDTGQPTDWQPSKARPRVERLSLDYMDIETGVVHSLNEAMKRVGLKIG